MEATNKFAFSLHLGPNKHPDNPRGCLSVPPHFSKKRKQQQIVPDSKQLHKHNFPCGRDRAIDYNR